MKKSRGLGLLAMVVVAVALLVPTVANAAITWNPTSGGRVLEAPRTWNNNGDTVAAARSHQHRLSRPGDVDDLKKGVGQIQTNLLSLLRSYGLREMPAPEEFDPNLHEALCTTEGEDGKVYEVFQKGYLLGPRVIRHAKVKVGKTSEKGEENG